MVNNAAYIKAQEIKLQQAASDNNAAVIEFIQCLGCLGNLGEKRIKKFVKEVARGKTNTRSL